MKYFVCSLIYVGLGFLVHYLFEGSVVDWSDSGSLAMIALWPFYLIFQFIKYALIAAGIVAIVILSWILIEKIRTS